MRTEIESPLEWRFSSLFEKGQTSSLKCVLLEIFTASRCEKLTSKDVYSKLHFEILQRRIFPRSLFNFTNILILPFIGINFSVALLLIHLVLCCFSLAPTASLNFDTFLEIFILMKSDEEYVCWRSLMLPVSLLFLRTLFLAKG